MILPNHTRFRWVPSGDVHIGHAALCWLSYHAAKCTGGTFVYRCMQLFTKEHPSLCQRFHQFAQRNYDDLCALGLTPTEGAVLASFPGMNASMRMETTDDKSLADYYYRRLGFEELYGLWPPDPPPDMEYNWPAQLLGNYEQGWMHPYHLVSQAVGDVVTRRNCIIRGDDNLKEAVFYNAIGHAIAKMHFGLTEVDHRAEYVFNQYYVPRIRRTGKLLPPDFPTSLNDPRGPVISSSTPVISGPFYIRNILDAGVEPEALFQYIGKTLFGSVEAASCVLTGWTQDTPRTITSAPTNQALGDVYNKYYGIQSCVYDVLKRIVPNPVVDDVEWMAFLKRGHL